MLDPIVVLDKKGNTGAELASITKLIIIFICQCMNNAPMALAIMPEDNARGDKMYTKHCYHRKLIAIGRLK